jgi:hypothetical protein
MIARGLRSPFDAMELTAAGRGSQGYRGEWYPGSLPRPAFMR